MGGAGAADAVQARLAAANGAYPALWSDFLRNRLAVAGERADALLQVLAAVPDERKDADAWVTEADFLYIAGACNGNAVARLERALDCYARALAQPDGADNSNARRMRAETLLRLRRYGEAFEAFGELAALPTRAAFGALEAAPFRLRHDAAMCERLAGLGRLPAATAADAARALRSVAARAAASPLPGGQQRWPSVAQLPPEDQAELRRGLFGDLARASAPYPPERLDAWRGPGAPDPLSSSVDWARVEREYREGQIAVVDDFFAPGALEELWRFALEAPCFRTVRRGFLGAFPADGNVHPLVLAAAQSLERHLPGLLAGHPLGLWWLFKYTEAGPQGIGIHADAAAVNMNIWLTPDGARRSGGGLDVYTALPPVEAGVVEINKEFATEEDEAAFRDKLLAAGAVRRVEYRRNRAVIFVSDLYHASQPFEFADCAAEPRVNLTLLFGDRAAERADGARASGAGAAAAESAAQAAVGPRGEAAPAGKRAREEAGWDLFD